MHLKSPKNKASSKKLFPTNFSLFVSINYDAHLRFEDLEFFVLNEKTSKNPDWNNLGSFFFR